MNKRERLAVAGAVAPSLRTRNERRVALVNADGEVVRYTTVAEVQAAVLKRQGIEIAVEPGVRPKMVTCEQCGKPVAVSTKSGRLPKRCKSNCGKRCAEPGCEKRARSAAFTPYNVAKRNGRPWRCTKHYDYGDRYKTRSKNHPAEAVEVRREKDRQRSLRTAARRRASGATKEYAEKYKQRRAELQRERRQKKRGTPAG